MSDNQKYYYLQSITSNPHDKTAKVLTPEDVKARRDEGIRNRNEMLDVVRQSIKTDDADYIVNRAYWEDLAVLRTEVSDLPKNFNMAYSDLGVSQSNRDFLKMLGYDLKTEDDPDILQWLDEHADEANADVFGDMQLPEESEQKSAETSSTTAPTQDDETGDDVQVKTGDNLQDNKEDKREPIEEDVLSGNHEPLAESVVSDKREDIQAPVYEDNLSRSFSDAQAPHLSEIDQAIDIVLSGYKPDDAARLAFVLRSLAKAPYDTENFRELVRSAHNEFDSYIEFYNQTHQI